MTSRKNYTRPYFGAGFIGWFLGKVGFKASPGTVEGTFYGASVASTFASATVEGTFYGSTVRGTFYAGNVEGMFTSATTKGTFYA